MSILVVRNSYAERVLNGEQVTMNLDSFVRIWGGPDSLKGWLDDYQVRLEYIGCGYYQMFKDRINRRVLH